MFPRAKGEAHHSSNWWTALYESSSRSPPNVLLNKTCMSEVARQVGTSIYELHAESLLQKKENQ